MQRFQEREERALQREIGSIAGPIIAPREDTTNQDAVEPDQQPFIAGQQVIWLYATSRHRQYRIAVEIVQVGLLRARIRSRTVGGKTIVRWVKPSNLRRWESEERLDAYPSNDQVSP